jgi:nucleotide-binding universal stress UspA family protein
MRIIAGVDWSDETFAAVEQIGLLYCPDEVVLVHGVDLGVFQSPLIAGAVNLPGYDDFRQALVEAGRQAIARCRTLLPSDCRSVRTLCEVQNPAAFVLESAEAVKANLIVVGTHDRSLVAEVFVGSVSHHVLLHAALPTLLVKGNARPVTRVLMAVEGHEDAKRMSSWLMSHPFKQPVAATILSVIPTRNPLDPNLLVTPEGWSAQRKRHAEQVVHDMAQGLAGPQFHVSTEVHHGDPVTIVCEVGARHDLIVIGSHGIEGIVRFLLGSVSHGIVHRAGCSVLVVR